MTAKKSMILHEITTGGVRNIYQLRQLIKVPAVRTYVAYHYPAEVMTFRRKTFEVMGAPGTDPEASQTGLGST